MSEIVSAETNDMGFLILFELMDEELCDVSWSTGIMVGDTNHDKLDNRFISGLVGAFAEAMSEKYGPQWLDHDDTQKLWELTLGANFAFVQPAGFAFACP